MLLVLLLASRRLVVFDLNSVLVYRCYGYAKDIPYDTSKAHRIGNMWYWKRPGVNALLARTPSDVAIWSSMRSYNVEPVLRELFPDLKPVFTWTQDHCVRVTPHPDPASKKEECWTKPVASIKAVYPQYGNNITIMDDCPYKMACNPPEHVMIVDPWTPDDTRDISDVIKLV